MQGRYAELPCEETYKVGLSDAGYISQCVNVNIVAEMVTDVIEYFYHPIVCSPHLEGGLLQEARKEYQHSSAQSYFMPNRQIIVVFDIVGYTGAVIISQRIAIRQFCTRKLASDITCLHKIDQEWTKDETKMENVTILAILIAKNSTTNQLLPISMTSEPETGITNVNAPNHMESIYNLMGVRMNQLKRGLNIVNGQKVMVK